MALSSRKQPAWLVLTLLCLAPRAHAARVVSVQVKREGALFQIGMRLSVDAPPAAVFHALQDYSALSRYTPDVRTIRIVRTSNPDRVLLFATFHACILFFCKTMDQEQVMTATADAHGGVLRSRLLPEGSDFKAGQGRWRVAPCPAPAASSCVDVRIRMVPAFWVPPLIGPWLIRIKMREQAHDASVGLQQLAQHYLRDRAKARSRRDYHPMLLINKPLIASPTPHGRLH